MATPSLYATRLETASAALLAAMAEPGAEFPDVCARLAVAHRVDGDHLRDAYDATCANPGPLTAAELQRADHLTRTHTAFSDLADMLDAAGHYRPSIHCGTRNTDAAQREELRELANLYDRAQAARGDARRAYRY